VLLVDDGSRPDEVPSAADLPSDVVLLKHATNVGKGGAVRTGVLAARGAYVVFTDSDLPFSLEPIPTTLAWLQDDADVVIGDRLLPESECEVQVTPMRRLSSAIFTFMVRRVVGIDFRDTQCGYKGYRAAVARRIFEGLEVTSFAFDVEVIVRALHSGCTIRRQPLRLVHNEDTSVRLSRHAPRMIMDMARIGWRARTGHYD
jgi:dolichyl-phosphate beta-glucosyltransferase